MTPRQGILHVHSTYSYDGEHSLSEIAGFAARRGYSFIAMSEHSDTFDHRRMAEYVDACQRLSTPTTLIIPGIEFRCDNDLHLVGLGVSRYTSVKDPLAVAQFIQEEGGIAVIAHPRRYDYRIPSAVTRCVDGIEVWNACYDGRIVPNPSSLQLLSEASQRRSRPLLAFGAQDLHRIPAHYTVDVTLSSQASSPTSILGCLRAGNFTITTPYLRFGAKDEVGWFRLRQLQLARQIYDVARRTRNALQAG